MTIPFGISKFQSSIPRPYTDHKIALVELATMVGRCRVEASLDRITATAVLRGAADMHR